ncbi:metallophosphoesterase [Rhodocytophaga rosea]|uniref:Metallophosphoesterase n=1 Tax=Rhodocytophaga rosea TaxID=2704465 RepID=A0A6C0GEN0_9BACT|nr:metallophosphoesterase [Rhodocytophaga rosea]QHT66408.1 metallophosphoesterase [Rhodocytophaga rosea]
MKIIAIGDIHGKSVWIRASQDNKEADLVIFLGDYVDGSLSNQEIYDNLHTILEIKKLMPEKVILLIGNHDLQYFYYPAYRCSGFRAEAQPALSALFTENKDLFSVAYQYKNYLFTHAGISGRWFETHQEKLTAAGLTETKENLAQVLNEINQTLARGMLHRVSMYRGGLHASGGITWADKKETMNDPFPGFHQVVGHSRVKEITRIDFSATFADTSITYTDCLDQTTAFLTLQV